MKKFRIMFNLTLPNSVEADADYLAQEVKEAIEDCLLGASVERCEAVEVAVSGKHDEAIASGTS